MVVPYTGGLNENFMIISSKHRIQVHFKAGKSITNLKVASKDKHNITQKSESYLGISVTGWSVMKTLLGNPQELLDRGLQST